ncbi:hypothetical protein GVAV_003388 [Gurleya vavrai]
MLNDFFSDLIFNLKYYYDFNENESYNYLNVSNSAENLNGIKSFKKHLSFVHFFKENQILKDFLRLGIIQSQRHIVILGLFGCFNHYFDTLKNETIYKFVQKKIKIWRDDMTFFVNGKDGIKINKYYRILMNEALYILEASNSIKLKYEILII